MPIELVLIWKGNCFVPATDQDMDLCLKLKQGQAIKSSWTRMRNYKFHCKFFALVNLGFDSWEPKEINSKYGIPQKNFDRFREDVIIRAGFYDLVYDLDGNCRPKAKSISFANMEEDEFEKLYSNTINVFLQGILANYTKDDLDKIVQDILNFD